MSGKVDLDRWTPHLAAAKREGKSMTQYAHRHGLSRHTLYAARQMLRRLNGKPALERRPRAPRAANKPVPDSAFAAVKLSALCAPSSGSAPRLRAPLAHGGGLGLMWGGSGAGGGVPAGASPA